MRLRGLLVGLHGLNVSSEICNLFEVNVEDLELLLYLEELIKSLEPEPPKGDHG